MLLMDQSGPPLYCAILVGGFLVGGLFPDGAGHTDRNFNSKGMGTIRRARETSYDLRTTYVPLETVRQPKPNDVDETLELMKILP